MEEMIANIFIIALLMESLVLHEMAHGYVAVQFGDQTAQRQGRITFNPIPHIDLMWTITIPIIAYFFSRGTFIIGGAKYMEPGKQVYRMDGCGPVRLWYGRSLQCEKTSQN